MPLSTTASDATDSRSSSRGRAAPVAEDARLTMARPRSLLQSTPLSTVHQADIGDPQAGNPDRQSNVSSRNNCRMTITTSREPAARPVAPATPVGADTSRRHPSTGALSEAGGSGCGDACSRPTADNDASSSASSVVAGLHAGLDRWLPALTGPGSSGTGVTGPGSSDRAGTDRIRSDRSGRGCGVVPPGLRGRPRRDRPGPAPAGRGPAHPDRRRRPGRDRRRHRSQRHHRVGRRHHPHRRPYRRPRHRGSPPPSPGGSRPPRPRSPPATSPPITPG